MRRSCAVTVLLALLFWATTPGEAEVLVGSRLNPGTLALEGRFGAAVAASVNVIAVGAYLSNAGAGAVFLFRRDNGRWIPFTDQPLPRSPGEQLGFDLALDRSGGRLLVGAPFARMGNVRCGAAYQYELDFVQGKIKTFEQIELPDACREDAEIGSAVAIEDGIRAIGARGAAGRMGRIYASFNEGRTFELLTTPGASMGDEIGQSLATDGQILVAGAPFSDFRGPESGAVYIFQKGSRTGTRFAPDTLRPEDAFGYAVAVENGRIAAGAPLSDAGGPDSGAVYLRQREADWIRLVGKNVGDQFGVSLALTEIRDYAGARRAAKKAGAVYPIAPSGLGAAMFSPCNHPNAEFGFAVAARGNLLVAGAFLENSAGTDAGAAYVFEPGIKLVASGSVPESAGNARMTIKLTSVPACEPIELKVSMGAETASAGQDFKEAIPGRVTLSAASTEAFIRVPIVNDRACEPNETFSVRLSDSSGELAQSVTILDDDAPGIVITPSPLRLVESSGQAALDVSLSSPPEELVTVSLRTDQGTVSPALLNFTKANWNRPRSVLVTERSLVGDTQCVSNRPFQLVATATFPCGVVSRSIRVARINDDRRCVAGVQRVCVRLDGTILYTAELSNAGDLTQADLPTDELFVDLPDEVTVLWAAADRGLATVDYSGNTVAWNGSIPPGTGTVRIEMITSLDSALLTTPVAAQGTLTFDREGDGTLDQALTDDPLQGDPAPVCAPPP